MERRLSKQALAQSTSPAPAAPARLRYSVYALCVFVLVNVSVLMDRQILSILAEDIKADLQLSDAQVGFIYSTALSVFFAIFSIPLGRCADIWTRKNMLSLCVAMWSAMIALTGAAQNFLSFTLFRAGVGVGEGGASPPTFSMISDLFPPRLRSTAMSVFTSGSPIGQGLGLFLGGYILQSWGTAFPDASAAPFGLKAWQAAFFAIALPGPFLALWLWSLREPVRGQAEALNPHQGADGAPANPLREVWNELMSVLPLLCLLRLMRLGGGRRALAANIAIGLVIALAAAVLIVLTGSVAQWASIGFGLYCVAGWSQTLALRDPPTFGMIFRCPTMMFVVLGVTCCVFIVFGVGAWIVPFMIRTFHVGPMEVGWMVGVLMAGGGFFGNLCGGVIADALERRTPRARLYVLLGSLSLTIPSIVLMLRARSASEAYIFIACFFVASAAWYGVAPSIVNSLVLPRMRGVASALFLIVLTLLGMALGPYAIGYISDGFAAQGLTSSESLRGGMFWSLTVGVLAAALLVAATANLERDETTRLERARRFGEPG
jgi:MFS family permease